MRSGAREEEEEEDKVRWWREGERIYMPRVLVGCVTLFLLNGSASAENKG